MINRRLILRAGLVGAATPIVLNAVPAAAAGVDPMASGLAGSVFYTSEHPGRWAGKEGGHAPQVERSANNIEITTGHPMDGFVHYIVKHTLLDENLNYVAEVIVRPGEGLAGLAAQCCQPRGHDLRPQHVQQARCLVKRAEALSQGPPPRPAEF
jgi:superoxide reductase